jgi:uncharacterized protein YndB with AHSA1/START domain
MTPTIQAVATRRFALPAARVFDAWLDPAWISRWMYGPQLRDERIVRLDVDRRVGGKFSFVVDRQGVEINHVGEYPEIDRPSLLVFTWATRSDPSDTSRVIVEIAPCDGGCELSVTQVMAGHRRALADQATGAWQRMLGTLAEVLPETNPLTLQPT